MTTGMIISCSCSVQPLMEQDWFNCNRIFNGFGYCYFCPDYILKIFFYYFILYFNTNNNNN